MFEAIVYAAITSALVTAFLMMLSPLFAGLAVLSGCMFLIKLVGSKR